MWPVLLGLISFVYSGQFVAQIFPLYPLWNLTNLLIPALSLRAFWQRRVQFAQLISSSSSLNASRYIRLMLLSIVDMAVTVPLGIFSIYIASAGVPLSPWISWENVHFNFSRVDIVPSIVWRSDRSFSTSVELTRWLFPACAFIFFALFGFASEAQKQYKTLFHRCIKPLGLISAISKPFKPSDLPRLVICIFSAWYVVNDYLVIKLTQRRIRTLILYMSLRTQSLENHRDSASLPLMIPLFRSILTSKNPLDLVHPYPRVPLSLILPLRHTFQQLIKSICIQIRRSPVQYCISLCSFSFCVYITSRE